MKTAQRVHTATSNRTAVQAMPAFSLGIERVSEIDCRNFNEKTVVTTRLLYLSNQIEHSH